MTHHTIFHEYVEYTAKYQALYGQRTVILMEVGSFFELYGVDSPTVKMGADVAAICDILNITLTRKDKSVLENSPSNPLMAGFPSHSLKKFVTVLLDAGYTIVLVEQTSTPPNPKRGVTKILSPSTYLDSDVNSSNQFLMCVYLEGSSYACYTLVDVTTGDLYCEEFPNDHTKEEMYRTLLVHKPREVVFVCGGGAQDDWTEYIDVLRSMIPCIHNRLKVSIDTYVKPAYQNAVLSKVWAFTGLLSPVEFIGMEKYPQLITCIAYTLNFVYEHNEALIRLLRVPKILQSSKYLVLANSCVENLNLTSGGGKSLLQLLNRCRTPMGKRMFQDRLLRPTKDIKEMVRRWDACETMIRDVRELDSLTDKLKRIYDVPRLLRKMGAGTLNPSEFLLLDSSLRGTEELLLMSPFLIECFPLNVQTRNRLDAFIDEYTRLFDIQQLGQFHIHTMDRNVFNDGVYPDIDAVQTRLIEEQTFFQTLAKRINALAKGDFVKVESIGQNNTTQLTITKARYEALKANPGFAKLTEELQLETRPVSSASKSAWKLHVPGSADKNQLILEIQGNLKARVTEAYVASLERLQMENQEWILALMDWVAEIDVTVANSRNALELGYVRPKLLEDLDASSFSAKNLRHPIIERINDREPYVANDVEIGSKASMLLYGINAVGKSSLMKSIGLAVLMAQAGMFVAASSLEMTAFDALFTRIPGGDNLYKGHSTFVAEMTEVRHILQRSTNRSLVIGDEVCSGTESVSAMAIVASALLHMVEAGTTFIFATHLHELASLADIEKHPNIRIYHMSVKFDEKSHRLIYDRRLREGSGNTLYGLEVCKSLDLPPEFLHRANRIRMEIVDAHPTLVNPHTSRYNATVFVDVCKLCGEKTTEIHHIRQQKDANEMGLIASEAMHFHKNRAFNLMGVCEACHLKIHHGEVIVEGPAQTSRGMELIVHDSASVATVDTVDTVEAPTEDAALNELIMSTYRVLLEEGKKNSMKQVQRIVESKYGAVSYYKVRKVLHGLALA
jgi:DNA mismatch repair protein MutS